MWLFYVSFRWIRISDTSQSRISHKVSRVVVVIGKVIGFIPGHFRVYAKDDELQSGDYEYELNMEAEY